MFLSVVFNLRKIWSHEDKKQYNSKDLTGAVRLRWSPSLWFTLYLLILTAGQNRKASCSSTVLGTNRK